MKNFTVLLSVFIFGFLLSANAFVDEITIEDVVKNPKEYDGEKVTVRGLVKQYTPGDAKSTSYYLLQGDYGGIIKVNTGDDAPETFKKYEVTGIVYYEPDQRNAFISEKSKVLVDVPDVTINEPQPKLEEESKAISNRNMLIIGGLGVVLIILLILLFSRKKKGKSVQKPEEASPVSSDEWSKPFSSGGTHGETTTETEGDFKTIKLNKTEDPKTLAFIPGELTIISGVDANKSFKIAGYPTEKGSVVTLGREKVIGDREYAHIQLVESTVSRKQAEIISNNGKLQVKNLSDTNKTVVDGVELAPGETVDLKPNSTIKTGEVEFKYTV